MQIDRRNSVNHSGFYDHSVNLDTLRSDRLQKTQDSMKKHGVDALILTDIMHIRYTTGVSVMPLWTAVNFAHYAVIPCEGKPHLFEYPESIPVLSHMKQVNFQPTTYWQYRFSGGKPQEMSKLWMSEIQDTLKSNGISSGKIGIDSCDFYGFQALQNSKFTLCDADEVIQDARIIKTDDEIKLMLQSATVCESALFHLEENIKPGVTENYLLSCFWQKMLELGGEWCFTRLIASGYKTNPWFQEAGNKIVRSGDLIAIDTDMIGPEGYACDISRTFLCGNKPTQTQLDAYKYSVDFINQTMELCTVGKTYEELAHQIPKVPKKYTKQRYPVFAHGIGTDDETPFLGFPDQVKGEYPKGTLRENMVLAVEFYAGEEGAQDGVKLEQQIYLTKKGPKLMTLYPLDEKFGY